MDKIEQFGGFCTPAKLNKSMKMADIRGTDIRGTDIRARKMSTRIVACVKLSLADIYSS